MVSIFGLGYNELDFIDQTVNLNQNTITNVAEPVNDADVATKQYVDSKIGSSSSTEVLKSGDTMTGDLLVNFNEVDAVRTLGCNNITSGKLFKIVLGDLNNRIEYNFTQPLGLYSSFGMNFFKSNTKLVGIGDGFSNQTSFYSGILMNAMKISDLGNPTVNSDAANKLYVDNRALLPTTRFTFPSATDNSGGYIWTDFVAIPNGLSELEFDSLPSGLYACFTSYIPSTRIGILPVDIKGYLTCYSYQNGVWGVYNKRYTWCSVANNSSEIYVASIFENTWNTWVIQTPLLTSGVNSMNSNLNMNSNKIINLVDPSGAQDAATKNYVDDRAYSFVDRFPPVDMAGLNSPAPFVVTTDNNAASGWYAFSHMDAQDWLCSSATGAWAQITGNFRFILKRFVIRGSFNGSTGTITNWNLEGSNDGGANFVQLVNQSFSGGGSLTGDSIHTILLPSNTSAFSSYRFNCTGGSGTVSINYIGLYSGISNFDIYGDNVMRGNINMDGRLVVNLVNPNQPNDAANKNYVDSNAASYMTAYPIMTANTTTIDGLSYTASASSVSTTANQPWISFQNTVVLHAWVAATGANEWIQMQYPFPISMSGFNIVARNISGRNITSWRIQASNDGGSFNNIIPTNSTVFNAGVLNKFTFAATAKYLFWRFLVVSSVGSIDVGLGMLQWIPTLTDRYLKKCLVGYVPRLTANINYRGFLSSASSELSANYIAANAFKGDYVSGAGSTGEWCTLGVAINFWIKIACPMAVRTWKFGFRGRNGNVERIWNWRIEGSTDDIGWIILYTTPSPTLLGSTYQEFLVDSVGKFQYYRLFVETAETSNPGLSSMQLFVYDD